MGSGTAERLARWGLKVDLKPAEFRADAIRDAMRAKSKLEKTRVLIPHANMTKDVLADELRKAGAEVTEVVAYRTLREQVLRDLRGRDIYRLLLDRQIDVVLFTSASMVHNFAELMGEEQAADLLAPTVVGCIGPVTAEAAKALNIPATVVAKDYTITGLVQAVVDHFRNRTRGTADVPAPVHRSRSRLRRGPRARLAQRAASPWIGAARLVGEAPTGSAGSSRNVCSPVT